MSIIYMVRHGQASFGSKNYDRLSEKGRRQCTVLAQHLLSLGLTFDAVYAGNMERQKDTAWELTSAFKLNGRDTPEPQLMPEFNEYNSRDIFKAYFPDVARDFPELTSDIERLYTDKKAFQRVFEKIVALWIAPDNAKPGVESWQEFSGRVRSGLRQVMAQNGRKKKILICTSGGPIAAAVQMTLDLADERAIRIAWHLINTSVTTFVYDDERLELATLNNAAHLEMSNDADFVTYR